MGTVKSTQRATFERDIFPHLEALQRTAQWLTMRRSYAEDLVLKTVTQAYRSWPVSDATVAGKARLFRILVGEFFDNGNRGCQPGRFLPEWRKAAADTDDKGRQYPNASVDRRGFLLLTGLSDIHVRGAIARLRPQSRLIMILSYRERFSHAEIAYVTGLRKDSVKLILARFRTMIPLFLVQHADCFVITADNRAKGQVRGACSYKEEKLGPCRQPGAVTGEFPTNSAAVNWDNEGGALGSQ